MPPTLARIFTHCSDLPPANGVLSGDDTQVIIDEIRSLTAHQLENFALGVALMLEQLHPSNA